MVAETAPSGPRLWWQWCYLPVMLNDALAFVVMAVLHVATFWGVGEVSAYVYPWMNSGNNLLSLLSFLPILHMAILHMAILGSFGRIGPGRTHQMVITLNLRSYHYLVTYGLMGLVAYGAWASMGRPIWTMDTVDPLALRGATAKSLPLYALGALASALMFSLRRTPVSELGANQPAD